MFIMLVILVDDDRSTNMTKSRYVTFPTSVCRNTSILVIYIHEHMYANSNKFFDFKFLNSWPVDIRGI